MRANWITVLRASKSATAVRWWLNSWGHQEEQQLFTRLGPGLLLLHQSRQLYLPHWRTAVTVENVPSSGSRGSGRSIKLPKC